MAVFPRGKKGVYYMDFIVFGVRIMRSTGKFTEREARKVEEAERERLEREIKEGTYGKEKLTLIRGFERAYEERWKYTKDGGATLARAKRLATIMGSETLIENIKQEDITKVIQTLTKNGCSTSTVNRYTNVIRTMLNMAFREWGELKSPPFVIKRFKEPKGRIREISTEEEQTILNYFMQYDKDMYDLVIVLTDTGCRLSEILDLLYKDIDFNSKMIRIWKNKADEPKSVPLTNRAYETLKRRDKQVFKCFNVDQVEKRWKKVRKVMNMEDDPEFVIHALRHTCASRLVKAGIPLRHVQKYLGHKSYSTTERYAHLQPDSLLVAVKVLEKR
jgi:integrase